MKKGFSAPTVIKYEEKVADEHALMYDLLRKILGSVACERRLEQSF